MSYLPDFDEIIRIIANDFRARNPQDFASRNSHRMLFLLSERCSIKPALSYIAYKVPIPKKKKKIKEKKEFVVFNGTIFTEHKSYLTVNTTILYEHAW